MFFEKENSKVYLGQKRRSTPDRDMQIFPIGVEDFCLFEFALRFPFIDNSKKSVLRSFPKEININSDK